MQIAFLLIFVAGGLSVWLLMRMSQQVDHERMDVIKNKINTEGGTIKEIELINRKHCPFSSEYQDPDINYKFYRVTYDINNESHQCWVTLEMKQRSYGPSGAIQTSWIWRGFA
jgi:hypothetical protein